MFPVHEALLGSVRDRLARHAGLRFLLGAAGSGKSTVARALAEDRGIAVLDMDERIYGGWVGRWDPERHPATRAWLDAPDPLAWQLALTPPAFLAFHAASTVEALDLLADELAERPAAGAPLLVDGGFGSVEIVARAVPPASIACLVPDPALAASAWTGDPDRRAFLDEVAGVQGIADPVARFLALDRALTARMAADAAAAGVAVLVRAPGTGVAALAAAAAEALHLAR